MCFIIIKVLTGGAKWLLHFMFGKLLAVISYGENDNIIRYFCWDFLYIY